MNKPIRVLQMNVGNFGIAGLSTIVFDFGDNMDNNNVIFDYFANKYNSNVNNYYIKRIKDKNGKIFKIKLPNNNILKQFILLYKIVKVINKNKYDIVHINADGATIMFKFYIGVKMAGEIKGIVLHSHSTGFEHDKHTIKNFLHKVFKHLYYDKNVYCLSCSKSAAQWMYTKKIVDSKKYIVINNGINTNKFAFNNNIRNEYRKKLNLENKFVIGHVGRFLHPKNHEFLIDVFNEVYKLNNNSVLLLIGDGPDKYKIKNKVEKLNIQNSVIFYGLSNEVNKLMQAMDCFLFPSRFEGLGTALIEAQCSGLKCFVSEAVPEEAYITNNIKKLYLNQLPKYWANEILTGNYNIKNRENAFNEVRKAGYDIKDSSKKLEKLYININNNIL